MFTLGARAIGHAELVADALGSLVELIADPTDEVHRAGPPGGQLAALCEDLGAVARWLGTGVSDAERVDPMGPARKAQPWGSDVDLLVEFDRWHTPKDLSETHPSDLNDEVGYWRPASCAVPDGRDEWMLALAALVVVRERIAPPEGEPGDGSRWWVDVCRACADVAHALWLTESEWIEVRRMTAALESALAERFEVRAEPLPAREQVDESAGAEPALSFEVGEVSQGVEAATAALQVAKKITAAGKAGDYAAALALVDEGERDYPGQTPGGATWAQLRAAIGAKQRAAQPAPEVAAEPEPQAAPEGAEEPIMQAAIDSGRLAIIHVGTTGVVDLSPEPQPEEPADGPEQSTVTPDEDPATPVEDTPPVTATASGSRGTVYIVHNVENGTSLRGVTKENNPAITAIMGSTGQRWNVKRGEWYRYLGHSRGYAVDEERVKWAALALRADGWTVESEIDNINHATGTEAPVKPYSRERQYRLTEVRYHALRLARAAGLPTEDSASAAPVATPAAVPVTEVPAAEPVSVPSAAPAAAAAARPRAPRRVKPAAQPAPGAAPVPVATLPVAGAPSGLAALPDDALIGQALVFPGNGEVLAAIGRRLLARLPGTAAMTAVVAVVAAPVAPESDGPVTFTLNLDDDAHPKHTARLLRSAINTDVVRKIPGPAVDVEVRRASGRMLTVTATLPARARIGGPELQDRLRKVAATVRGIAA